MTGATRVIWEVFPGDGLDPIEQVDTDLLSPPAFEGIVARGAQQLQVAPGATDVAVVVPASCAVLLVSSAAVLLRLTAGETQMRVRRFLVDSDDAEGQALPARTLLLSGNGVDTADVQVFHLTMVA